MIKYIKYSLKILLVLMLVSAVSLIGIITLVNPNKFKSSIQNQLAQTTGQIITINGHMSWHVLPALSLEARELSNPSLTVKKIRFEPKLWALITGKLLVDVYVNGLNVNLNQTTQTADTNSILKNLKTTWMLPYTITLEDASFNTKDLHYKNISLTAKKISLGAAGFATPITAEFDVADPAHDQSGHVSLKAEWAFNKKAQQVEIKNIELNTNFPALPFSTLLGELQIQPLKNAPVISGKLQVPNLSLQYALSHFDLPFYPVSAKSGNLTANFNYQSDTLEVSLFNLALENDTSISGSFKSDLQGQTLKTLSLLGTFEAKNLRVGTIPIPEFKTNLQAKNGIFIFDQIKAQLASSHHQAKFQINLQGDVPQFALVDEINSFEINEVLARLDQKDKIYGNIQAKANLTTQGNTLVSCLQNLSGKAYVHLTDGRIRGIDLSPLLRHAQSTVVMLKDSLAIRNSINVGAILTAELGEWRLQAMNYDQLMTPFRHLETNIIFDRGRAYTSDFKLTHPEYTVTGHGVVDLLQKSVESQALALLTHAKTHSTPQLSLFLKETPLAIQVKGSLDNLAIQPNLAHYADGAIHLVHKETTEKAADQTLEKLFGFP